MVEAPSSSAADQSASAADQTLAFFDSVFMSVPPMYRQVDQHDNDTPQKGGTQKNGKKAKAVSLMEINERAAARVGEI